MRHPRLVVPLVILLLTNALPVPAQQPSPSSSAPAGAAPAAARFKPDELEQIAAPIALYPDPVVAQVYMASTYSLDIVQAARFMRDNANLKGDVLDAALKNQPWDDSVKSLLTFPNVNKYNNFTNNVNVNNGKGKLTQNNVGGGTQSWKHGPEPGGADRGGTPRAETRPSGTLGGFALVAFPAQYGVSGIMTSMVNHDGVVYQKDLGPQTASIAKGLTEFNPDDTWKRV